MENFLKDLLPALYKKGAEISAIVHHHAGSAKTNKELEKTKWLHRVPSYGSILYAPVSPLFPFRLNNLVKSFRPDIIHVHMPNTSAFWLLLLGRAQKIPWVIHWHSDVVASTIDTRMRAAYTLYRPMEQLLLSKCSAIISTSHNYLDSSTPLQPWTRKCVVIPLGLDPKRFPCLDSGEKNRPKTLWRKGREFRVLAIGRLTYYKGHEILIRAAVKIPNIQILIVGHGSNRTKLNKLITKLQVEDKVTLCGMLPQPVLRTIMSETDCFCLPSVERTEAFGLVLLEAMHYGKAVIASNVPGSAIGWIVENGKTGFLFEPGNVSGLSHLLRDLSKSPEMHKAMGRSGKIRFDSTFHIDMAAARTIDLYKQILDAPLPVS
ncbi:MAG: glycosyltransferase [Deltaproteobacteria bacterium]|nr:glycosyltransferase [Deltaproteobacteria bacterium]